jgi:cytoskeletal protein CcmA (bactofilin family)
MKRRKLLLAGLLVALPVLLWAVGAQAQSFRSGDDVTVTQNQVVDKTLFAAGRTVDIAGKVNGDVFCAGENVTITGTVTGDVICAGQNVRIAGTVEGDVRVAGQNVTLGGTIAHNLTAAAQSLMTEAKGTVGEDASIAGQDAVLNGSVGRDLAAGAQTITVNGTINRDVQAQVENLTLGSNAKVGGNLEYTSVNLLVRDTGAQVAGSITRKAPTAHRHQPHFGSIVHIGVWFGLYMFVALLIVALVLVLIAPRAFHAATEVAIRRPGKTLLVGFVASVVAPVVIAILMFSVVGIPLALLVVLAWVLTVLLAGPFAAYYLGRVLMTNSTNAILIMLLGAVILLLFYVVPILGALVWLVALWFGLGIILLQVPRLPRPRHNLAVETAEAKPKKEK